MKSIENCSSQEMSSHLSNLEGDAERLRVLFQISFDGIAIFDQDHRIIDANARFAEMLGYPLEELLRLHTWDFEAALTESQIRSGFSDLSRIHTIFETRHKRKDGTVYDAEVSASGTCLSGKNVVITFTRDITRRKRAEEAMRLGNSLLNATLESTADGILVSDGNGKLTSYNQKFLELWRIPEALVITEDDNRLLQFVLDQLQAPEVFLSKVNELYQNPEATSWDELVFQDGRVFERYSQPQRLDNKVVGRVWSFRDVTHQKRQANELEQHRAHLEELVEKRTCELEIAKQKAESANLAKSAFLANMSHELLTPMHGVLGMAHLVRRGGVTPKQADQLDKLDVAGKHLVEIINGILDLTKIEAGRISLEASEFDLNSVTTDVAAIVTPIVEVKQLQLSIENPTPSYKLIGDLNRLKQALLNYAGNAIKFTSKGDVTLRCLLAEETATDVLVRFEVEDTGIGIDLDVADKLFNAFEQADSSMTRKHGGTGLGLTITKKLAELMGGAAGVRSTPGIGSAFWFTARLQKAISQRRVCCLGQKGY